MQECMSHYPELYGREEDDELSNAINESVAEDSSKSAKAAAAANAASAANPANAAHGPLAAGDAPAEAKKTK